MLNDRLLYAALLGLLLCTPGAHGKPSAGRSQDKFPSTPTEQRRYDQAARLIGQAQNYIRQANEFHKVSTDLIAQAKAVTDEAKALQGSAKKYHSNNAIPNAPKLKGAELKAANAQYAQDLEAFKSHATNYNLLIEKFNKQIGQCLSNEASYQDYLKEYQLHCKEFHMPNIAPPHICGQLHVTDGEASHIAGQYRADQMKVAQAAQELANQENRLRNAEAQDGAAEANLITAAVRSQRERELVDAFGKLRQEYELLKIEKNQLDGSTTQISNSRVAGKIKKPR
jgi:hypothetical protein